jgi:hypothetical protein
MYPVHNHFNSFMVKLFLQRRFERSFMGRYTFSLSVHSGEHGVDWSGKVRVWNKFSNHGKVDRVHSYPWMLEIY